MAHEIIYSQTEPDHPVGIKIDKWVIKTNKNIIISYNELEKKKELLGLPDIPDMYFAHNYVQFEHENGFKLSFNPDDGIKAWNPKAPALKVAVAEQWQSKRQSTQNIKKQEYDWSFTTSYAGTLSSPAEPTTERIDVEKLKVPDPILFFDDLILFEDEYDDNGVGQLNVKVRVMPKCFYCLQRFFMRVDGVLFRSNETRVYHEFGSDYILREYSEKEAPFKDVKGVPLNDPNAVSQVLPSKTLKLEKIYINKSA